MNLSFRYDIGIIAKQHIVFVMSKNEINFYDLANYYKSLRSKNALYLDVKISRNYLPAKNWILADGNLEVISWGRDEDWESY